MSSMGAAALLLGAGEPTKGPVLETPTFSDYPFGLGVASGDPLSDNILLWTRLAPNPLIGGGMPQRDVKVRWEVASDENFSEIARSGTFTATPEFAHSVHVEVGGSSRGGTTGTVSKRGTRSAPLAAPRPRRPLMSR
jgi:alkaline phosphatase D